MWMALSIVAIPKRQPVCHERKAMISTRTQVTDSPASDLFGKVTDLKAYYRQLERRFILGGLIAFLVPLALLSAYFHYQFHVTLKETGQLNLAAIAESQRNTVDLFLQERLVNLFALFNSNAFTLEPSQNNMERLLQQLKRASDAFIDVGFLIGTGVQTGYAGPFPALQNKDYSAQKWFVELMSPEQDLYISDIYLGFRNKPHFTIAAKKVIEGRSYVLRATLDPDKFYLFLKTINHSKGVESILINREGRIQLADPWSHEPLDVSAYVPPGDVPSGAQTIRTNGDSVLIGHAWLKEVPWALLVNEPLNIAYAQLYQARRIMLISSTFILLLVGVAIWVATRALVAKARDNAEKREELSNQLLHASKLASLGELATGVAHEINNPLAIIVATTGVIKDMLNPEFNMTWTKEQIIEELKSVEDAVFRARRITQQLLNYGHKTQPRLVPSNVNDILEEVLSGFKERSLALADIQVVRRFDPGLPDVLLDHDLIRQVFLNLINNAGDAIEGPGRITIETSEKDQTVRITVTDTGKGMDSEQMKYIFDPFFTTKEVGKGTGLGLSVSIGIVESMGGRMEVQSLPGAGSAFTVVLPKNENKGAINATYDTDERRQRIAESSAN